MRLSLKQRLFVLIAVALAPALAILAYNEIDLRRTREAEVHALALRYGLLAASEMRQIFEGVRSLLIAVAEVPPVRDLDGEACNRYLAEVVRRVPSLTAISAADGQGVIRCASTPSAFNQSIADRTYFAEVQSTRDFTTGEYTIGRGTSRAVLPLAMPLSGRDGTVGVLVTGLDLAWLQTRLRERGLTREGSLTIADRKGVILARDPLPERFVGTSIPDSYQRLVNAPTPGTEEVLSQDGTRRAIGYVPTTATDGALYISAGISLDEAFAPVDRATQWSIAVILMATAAAVVLAYLVGHRFIQAQVRQILTTIAAWRGGNDAARTGMDPRGGELEAVGAAFDSLANELAARQSAQRRAEAHRDLLMGELTHRIKNTLATVQAIAALTFRKAGLPASVRRDFEARLASLATAHDVLSAKSWESAGLLDLLQQSTRPYQQAERQRVRLSGPDLMIKSQAVLSLSMALNELCTNAAKYGALSAEQGTVDISWGVHGASDAARFTLSWIERSGPPVAPPAEEGFGSFLIKRVVAGELSGTAQLDFAVTGLTCTIEAPASAVVEGEVVHPLRQSA